MSDPILAVRAGDDFSVDGMFRCHPCYCVVSSHQEKGVYFFLWYVLSGTESSDIRQNLRRLRFALRIMHLIICPENRRGGRIFYPELSYLEEECAGKVISLFK